MFEIKDGKNHEVNRNAATRGNSYLSRQSVLKTMSSQISGFGSTGPVLTSS